MRQNKVRRVATGADRRDHQTPLEQAFAMDAFGIVLQDLVLRNVVSKLDGRTLVMAAPAQKRNLGGGGGRAASGGRQNVVSSVAIRTARREHVTTLRRLSV